MEDYLDDKGKFMALTDQPSSNDNHPWTARLLPLTDLPACRLKLDNYVSNRSNPLYASAEIVYEKGRQFTLELGYRF